MLGTAGVEAQHAARQQGEHLLGLGRRSAGVAGLRGVYRGESQPRTTRHSLAILASSISGSDSSARPLRLR